MGSQPPSPTSRPATRSTQPADGRDPVWRAHNVFRIVTFCWALVWFVIQHDDYARPSLALAEIVLMAGWTVYTVRQYWSGVGRTNRLVFLDQIVVTTLFLANEFILTESQMLADSPSVVSAWQPSMITAAAAQWGMLGGGITGLVAALSNFAIRAHGGPIMAMDTLLLLATGVLVGLNSETARKSTERLAQALRAEAATAERERLARSIHDSVLQVLARVRQRGRELGGEAAGLAELAGEQEVALRSLVATGPPETGAGGETDLAAKLRVLGTGRTEVSAPPTSVPLPEPLVSDLHAMVREALENVDRHAGPDAKSWVLLEDLGNEVAISVRDDGPGIPEGRLNQAEAAGRMGIAQSIRGRIDNLGGTISLSTEPGEGTEWEVRVPVPGKAHSGQAAPVASQPSKRGGGGQR